IDRDFATLWRLTLGTIRMVSGASVIIDSSKSTRGSVRRPALLANAGERAAVVHLVRHPQDVLASVRKGSNRALEHTDHVRRGNRIRALAGWLVANLAAEWSTPPASSYVRIRYEDLVLMPDRCLQT